MTSLGLDRPPVVLAAPSGSGKTTIARALVEREPDFAFSVSATTRPPRPGEEDGRDYWFVSEPRFREMVRNGELAEWAEVHGNLYGTPVASLVTASQGGRHVVLDIDVQGARQIREAVPEAALLFILPPSTEVLFERLRARGTEGEETLRRRLTTALKELAAAESFDHFVLNDDLERAIEEVRILARTGRPPPEGGSASVEAVRSLEAGIRALMARETRPGGSRKDHRTG
jgi:guanylate kinase